MKVGIIGIGHVGGIMHQIFPDAVIYDEPKDIGTKEEINSCDIAFVCVPTPKSPFGFCDTRIVETVLNWLEADIIVLRSTVPVGFTDWFSERLMKNIVFQPEYYGETHMHPFRDPQNRPWITLGGERELTKRVAQLYQTVYTSELIINQVDAKVAEMAKYMENSFLATKVTFCNEFYDICEAMDIDYNEVRETWLLDPRISRSHTFVYPDNRGYGGSCLPKDTAAIIWTAEENGVTPTLLKAVEETNKRIKGETDD